MDFFEHQELAKRNSRKLLALFVLALVAVIVAVYGVTLAAITFLRAEEGRVIERFRLIDGWLFAGTAAGVLAIVAVGSLWKTLLLRRGGEAVANMLGGRRLWQGRGPWRERRLLNVVEEMSLASGLPVPPVYVVEGEKGINAFAAGHRPGDAVVGVTEGAVEALSREELQGVVAHEFSHILHGDMRLNLRLIGLVYGILVISLIGRVIMRSSAQGSRREKGGRSVVILFGLALTVIGYAGSLCGDMIKAAISRQREFLADASAVQFTRNPLGLAGALKKIGGHSAGSRMKHPEAEEVSHMLFAMGLGGWSARLFATHPPLEKRILKLDPSFDGRFPVTKAVLPEEREEEPVSRLASQPGLSSRQPTPAQLAQRAGKPLAEDIEEAGRLIQSLPERILQAAREPYGARALAYFLLLDEREAVREAQIRHLRKKADGAVMEQTRRLFQAATGLAPQTRLPLAEMAIPALRELAPTQYLEFKANVEALIVADDRVEVFEWALRRLVLRHLEAHFSPSKPAKVRFYSLKRLVRPCSILLSRLARAGHPAEPDARRAFQAGRNALQGADARFLPESECGWDALDEALDVLETASPKSKRTLLAACAETISFDRRATAKERDLLRAIADALDCPIPLCVQSDDVSTSPS